jgi:glycosyltransferase involved in cell wall biosynthesis
MVVHGPYPVGEPRVRREAAAAAAAGFEVDVLAMRRAGEPSHDRADGGTVVRLPLTHRREGGAAAVVAEYVSYTLLATAVAAYRQLRRGYAVVHVHNPPDFLVLSALVPRLLGARVIFDVHDLSPHMFGVRFARGGSVATRVLRVVQRAAAGLADAVLTVHDPYRRELAAEGVPPEKIEVVMNSLDERLLPARPAARAPVPRIVYHGTITPWYGVGLLVEAARILRDEGHEFRVEIYGEGDSVPTLREAIAADRLEDRVHLSGRYLGHEEVLAAVAGAAIGVIPNLPNELNRFALSSKLFEYVVLGIPVVSADLLTIREHFPDGEVAFFQAGDAASLARALAGALADPAAARRRADRALELYRREYAWAVQARRYVQVLERLTAH